MSDKRATAAEMVQQYPALKAGMEDVTAQLSANERAINALKDNGNAVPRAIDTAIKLQRQRTVAARVAFFTLKDMWTAAIAEARRNGSMSAGEYQQLQDVGLSGSQGLGFVFLIGWPLAVAIAAVLAPAAFIAAYSLTAESRAQAKAIADQNSSLIAEWKSRVTRENETGVPALPLPTLPEPSIKPSTSSPVKTITTAIAGAGIGFVALAGLGLWLYMKKKKGAA